MELSNKGKLEQVLSEIEQDLKGYNWSKEQIRKYVKRVINEYFAN